MIYSIIVSAGNQKRFGFAKPKSLMEIGGKPLIEHNIEKSLDYCDKTIITTSFENSIHFEKYNSGKVDIVKIKSGFGCGDAVLKTLETINYTDKDTCFVMWGDSLQNNDMIYSDCIKTDEEMVVPVMIEESPYVQIVPDDKGYVSEVRFSKYNDIIDANSYHDASIFYGNMKCIRNALVSLRDMICVDGKYVCGHDNELVFLDIFNNTWKPKAKILETKGKVYSFNTIDEYNEMKKSL